MLQNLRIMPLPAQSYCLAGVASLFIPFLPHRSPILDLILHESNKTLGMADTLLDRCIFELITALAAEPFQCS